MTRFSPNRIKTGLLALVTFAFVSCATLGGGLPAALVNSLGEVTGLGTQIADWRSSLGNMVDDTALGQLKGYADQAGALGSKISEMKSDVSAAMANPLGAIGDKLQGMAGVNIDQIRSLAPEGQMKALDGFAKSASGVGDLAKGFLDQFGG